MKYGIRPEHIELADEGIPATVAVVEPTGSETLVFFRLGNTDLVAVFRERHSFKPGETVFIRPNPDMVHLFDAQGGDSLRA